MLKMSKADAALAWRAGLVVAAKVSGRRTTGTSYVDSALTPEELVAVCGDALNHVHGVLEQAGVVDNNPSSWLDVVKRLSRGYRRWSAGRRGHGSRARKGVR